MTPPVLIAGAGIGGLSLAAALKQRGIDSIVLERTPQFAPIGAGIALSVNAMAVMRSLGLADDLIARGNVLRRMDISDETGRVLSTSHVGSLETEFGPTVAFHRGDLHDVLLKG